MDAEIAKQFSFSPDEKYFGKLRDFVGTTDERPAHEWTPLFKQVYVVEEPTTCMLRLQYQLPAAADATDPAHQPVSSTFALRVFDNDTMAQVPRNSICLQY